ncbi:MAG: sugar phosphate isomerase/epimerase family protein [Thermomicrobiales bacterium]
MELGIFDMVLARPTFAETLDAVKHAGFSSIQLDYAAAGLASMPAEIPDAVAREIRHETEARGITIAAVGGTYNMIHPDPQVRAEGMASLRAIAASCTTSGTSIVTLSTGTRDATNMWHRHPANDTPDAWNDLLDAMTSALMIADEYDVLLAFEPEQANVASNPAKARQLLNEIPHPRLKICFDAANIAASDLMRDPAVVIDEACALFGNEIATAHGKDITADGKFCAAGTGIVPWPHCVRRFSEVGYGGSLVLHSLSEGEIATARAAIER